MVKQLDEEDLVSTPQPVTRQAGLAAPTALRHLLTRGSEPVRIFRDARIGEG